MHLECIDETVIAFRNFNLCPDCQLHGEQALLCRLCEGLPMISRSDGTSFHLLLADRPLPYPNEHSTERIEKISVCFWYSHISQPHITNSTVVTLPSNDANRPAMFRTIETIADLLAPMVARSGHLAQFYDFDGESLCVIAS